jgi:hypothetical protein
MGKTFRLTVNDKTYRVEIGDLSQSTIEVTVDGEMFSVRLERDAQEMDRGQFPCYPLRPVLWPLHHWLLLYLGRRRRRRRQPLTARPWLLPCREWFWR